MSVRFLSWTATERIGTSISIFGRPKVPVLFVGWMEMLGGGSAARVFASSRRSCMTMMFSRTVPISSAEKNWEHFGEFSTREISSEVETYSLKILIEDPDMPLHFCEPGRISSSYPDQSDHSIKHLLMSSSEIEHDVGEVRHGTGDLEEDRGMLNQLRVSKQNVEMLMSASLKGALEIEQTDIMLRFSFYEHGFLFSVR